MPKCYEMIMNMISLASSCLLGGCVASGAARPSIRFAPKTFMCLLGKGVWEHAAVKEYRGVPRRRTDRTARYQDRQSGRGRVS